MVLIYESLLKVSQMNLCVLDYLPKENSAIDVKELETSSATAQPFPFFCIGDFLDEEFAKVVSESYLSLAEAQTNGEAIHAVNAKGKVQITDAAKFAPAISRLNEVLASRALRASHIGKERQSHYAKCSSHLPNVRMRGDGNYL